LSSPDEAKKILENRLEEKQKKESPRLASLGQAERIKALLNHKVDAEAVLDSAASHTFVPLELVEKLGVKVDVRSSSRQVSWIASVVSLEILGSVNIDLTMYSGQGGRQKRIRELLY
jgi:uncharacterized membrane protein YhfC